MKIASLLLNLIHFSAQALPILSSSEGTKTPESIVGIYPDHQDENLFYYMPQESSISKNQNEKYRLSLGYWDLDSLDPNEGGAFFHIALKNSLSDEQRNFMRNHTNLRDARGKETFYAPIPILHSYFGASDSLSEQMIKEASIPPHGPTIGGNMAISATLTKRGAKYMRAALSKGGDSASLNFCYNIKGLSHQLDAKVHANWKKIYTHFKAKLEGKVFFFKVNLKAGVKKLITEGSIQVITNGDDKKSEAFIQKLTNTLEKRFFKNLDKEKGEKSSKSKGPRLSLKYFKESDVFKFDFEIKKRVLLVKKECNPLGFTGIQDLDSYVFDINR